MVSRPEQDSVEFRGRQSQERQLVTPRVWMGEDDPWRPRSGADSLPLKQGDCRW
jgi:hypothetical protein